MDLKKIDNIYKIILDKVELDNKGVGLTPDVLKAFEWLSDEINEAKVEFLNEKQVYLEDELGDIIWCTLRLIELLDQKGHINKNNILNRLEKKYSQRTYGIKEGLCWDDIKNKQKVELKNEQELLDNLLKMNKIFIIGGGVEFSNYKDYHEFVSSIDFNPYEEKFVGWKDNLSNDLGDKFEVIKIPMPNKDFADYISWKIMFEKAFTYFGEKNILIGHSLGGTFLLKYLQENNLENISQIHLVAPAVFDSDKEKLGTFGFDKNLENFKKYENITNLYFSKDDTIVGFENCEYLQKILKNSKFEIFEDRWHFVTQENFGELVRNVKRF